MSLPTVKPKTEGPLSDEDLADLEANRDLGAEPLQAIQEMKAGQTSVVPQSRRTGDQLVEPAPQITTSTAGSTDTPNALR